MLLFEVDIADAVTPYVTNKEVEAAELDSEVIQELRQAHEALERELAVSQRVKASTLEELDLDIGEAPQLVQVAKEMPPDEKKTMIESLREFMDVFAWSYKDIGGLDPKLYQH